MGRCTVIVAKTATDHWQLIIQGKDYMPSYKELVEARYKYLPDDVVMAQIFPPKDEFNQLPDNVHHLFEIVND